MYQFDEPSDRLLLYATKGDNVFFMFRENAIFPGTDRFLPQLT
jgi:hypothetical protein